MDKGTKLQLYPFLHHDYIKQNTVAASLASAKVNDLLNERREISCPFQEAAERTTNTKTVKETM